MIRTKPPATKPAIQSTTTTEQRREIETSRRYLQDAEAELAAYGTKRDLIGRALADQRGRMRAIWKDAIRGIPFKS